METTLPSNITVDMSNASPQRPVKEDTITQGGWKFTFLKGAMCSTKVLATMDENLNINSIPDIVYADNLFQMTHLESGFTYYVNALEGLKYISYKNQKANFHDYEKEPESTNLDSINYLPPKIKVAVSKHWKNRSVPADVEVDKAYEVKSDWTFTTPYKGTIVPDITKLEERMKSFGFTDLNPGKTIKIVKTDTPIPKEKLGQDNPILHFSDLFLFESDLDDFGMSQFRIRFRVMGNCAFGLLRHYLRNDNMLVRVVDTRIYIDFDENFIHRDFSVRENTYKELENKFKFTPQFNLSADGSDLIYPHLTVRQHEIEKIQYKDL